MYYYYYYLLRPVYKKTWFSRHPQVKNWMILLRESFKQKFKSARAEVGEAPTQFIARLENYLMRWIDLANVEKDFDGLMSLIVREQYLES